MTKIPVGATIVQAYRFAFGNFVRILAVVWAAWLVVAVLGFVPPQILDWDAKSLAGKVAVTGVVEAAQKYVAEARAQGADLVVALSHGGLDASPYSPKMENGSLYLTTVPGVPKFV